MSDDRLRDFIESYRRPEQEAKKETKTPEPREEVPYMACPLDYKPSKSKSVKYLSLGGLAASIALLISILATLFMVVLDSANRPPVDIEYIFLVSLFFVLVFLAVLLVEGLVISIINLILWLRS